MTRGRRRRVDEIPEGQSAVVGVNIRTLRQRKGWSQAKLGQLMGWQSSSTVCAAEGRRDGRQGVSPAGKSSGYPLSSASPPGSSRRGARTATATRRPGSPAWHAEPRLAVMARPGS